MSADRSAGSVRSPIASVAGWALVLAAVTTPLLAWLGPLGFALQMAIVGLLCLATLSVREADRPLAIVLLLALAWAAISTLWSAYRPKGPEDSVALKLALALPLYWAAWRGGERADAALRRRALRILAWGLAGYGVLLLIEAATGGGVYQALRQAIGDPIRPDLGRKNVAHGSFALALLWPVAAMGGVRAGAPWWLAIPMALGAGVVAFAFFTDAVTLAVPMAVAVGLAAWAWPRSAPKVMGFLTAVYVLAMPLLVMAIRASDVARELPLSWSQRVGYWVHALDAIAAHPFRGSGLDASRALGPGIQLHPHNGALQVWVELGAVGAVLIALLFAALFRGLSRSGRDPAVAATAASLSVYVLFGAVSFGAWQEWWLGLGALAAAIAAMAAAERRTAAKASTSGAVSG